jgi:hypothetical protein
VDGGLEKSTFQILTSSNALFGFNQICYSNRDTHFIVGTVLQYGTLDYYWYFLATQDLNCNQEQTQADREPN